MIKWIKSILSNKNETLNTEEFEASLIPEKNVEAPKPKKTTTPKPNKGTKETAPKKRGRPKKNADSA